MRYLPSGTQNQIDFTVLNVNADGTLIQPVDEWQIALGQVPGTSINNKFGHNAAVGSGTLPEDIWIGGGVYTGFPTGDAELIQCFSSSASDTGVLTISGLDENWLPKTASVTLTGTTPVTIPTLLWRRVHTSNYNNASATTFNVGTITVRHVTTTANVFSVVPIGTSQSQDAVYTVPAGYTAVMNNMQAAIRGATAATVDGYLWIREFGKSPRLRRPFSATTGVRYQEDTFGGIVLQEKSDITARVTAATTGSIDVVFKFDILLVQNQE